MPTAPNRPDPETIVILAGLLQSQMGLEEGVVSIYNQKRRLEPKSGLYLDVACVGFQPFGVVSRPRNDPADPDMIEAQSVSQQEVVQVDIFSRNEQARLRRVEVIFALTGVAAQQASEQYGLRIGRIPPSFVDASQGEGAARLNRYALTFNVLRTYFMERRAPTFSKFQNPPQLITTNP